MLEEKSNNFPKSKASKGRRGQKWTPEEDKQLMDEFKQKKSMSEIAEKHQRSINPIEMKQRQIVKKLHQDGKTNEEIAELTNLTEEQVSNRLD